MDPLSRLEASPVLSLSMLGVPVFPRLFLVLSMCLTRVILNKSNWAFDEHSTVGAQNWHVNVDGSGGLFASLNVAQLVGKRS